MIGSVPLVDEPVEETVGATEGKTEGVGVTERKALGGVAVGPIEVNEGDTLGKAVGEIVLGETLFLNGFDGVFVGASDGKVLGEAEVGTIGANEGKTLGKAVGEIELGETEVLGGIDGVIVGVTERKGVGDNEGLSEDKSLSKIPLPGTQTRRFKEIVPLNW